MKSILLLLIISLPAQASIIGKILGTDETIAKLENVSSATDKTSHYEKKLGLEIEDIGDIILEDPTILDQLFGDVRENSPIINYGYKKIILKDWGFIARWSTTGDFYSTRTSSDKDVVHININTHSNTEEIEDYFREINKTLPINRTYLAKAKAELRTKDDLRGELETLVNHYISLPVDKAEAFLAYSLLVEPLKNVKLENIDMLKIEYKHKSWLEKSEIKTVLNKKFLTLIIEKEHSSDEIQDLLIDINKNYSKYYKY